MITLKPVAHPQSRLCEVDFAKVLFPIERTRLRGSALRARAERVAAME
jgi:hypothetical protein